LLNSRSVALICSASSVGVNLKEDVLDGDLEDPLPNDPPEPNLGRCEKLLEMSRDEVGREGPGVPRKLNIDISSGL
jgi:hypothetical protein